MQCKLLVLDVDGTLLNDQKEITQRLGYKTHSAVSKRMKIMNKDFKKFLGFEN